MLEDEAISEVEEVGIVCALPSSSRLLLKCLRALLETRDERRRINFLRAVLLRRKDLALSLIDGAPEEFFEINAFREVADLKATRIKGDLLFQRILAGEFKSPTAWTRLATQLGRFTLAPKNKKLVSQGLLNPFALSAETNRELSLKFPARSMPAFQGGVISTEGQFWFQ
jgi:hypothetical protein